MNEDIIRLSIKEQGEGREGERPDLKLERGGRMILGLGMKPKRDTFFYLHIVLRTICHTWTRDRISNRIICEHLLHQTWK